MNPSGKWSVGVTLAVIFGLGLVLGMWLNQRAAVPPAPVLPPPPKYEALESGEAVVMRVYRDLSPAVVNIVATSLAVNFWMQIVPQQGQGSGFVIDPRGYILTNNHVVANAEILEVTFVGSKKVQAKLVGKDAISDLAVIKVEPFPEMQVAAMGNSDSVSVGQRAIAIGNPFGFQHTVTAGFVSALNRDITIGQRTMMGLIQTDAAINPGNSGGPLINSRGEVVGINSAIYSQTGGFMGIGLAVPINKAKKVAEQLMKVGRVVYPWVGIQSSMDIDPQISVQMGLSPVRGILIFQIAADSPADRARLRGGNQRAYYGDKPVLLGGDVILSADDTPTPTQDDFQAFLYSKNVGDHIQVKILRSNKEHIVELTLAADPRIKN
ncbi:MAG TPA: trypsin-like peptidase domain-containing protein [Desulfomonilaceae bacterium]|nr:trypsin-like peptidase domain-containing protein [Desulfomonilaceae bacterium]